MKKNILLITCHDLGQHLGCYGVKSVNTPNIDELASRGIMFNNSYSTSAVCSPGRGSLLTGRYPQSNGLMGLIHSPWDWSLNEGEKHVAQILKECGYYNYLIGFNHVNFKAEELGYDKITSDFSAENIVTETCKLINNYNNEKPFFAKVGFTEVHRPFKNGKYLDKGVWIPPWLQETEKTRNDLANFQATINYLDSNVGRILKELYSSEIAEETLVIFTSDHGIPYPGAKWSARKAGIEVPLIMYQPGTALSGGKKYNQLISNIDILPTLFDLLNIEIPENIQGISFRQLIEDKNKVYTPRNEIFAQYTPDMKRDNQSRCILTEEYHLIRYFDNGRSVDYPVDVDPVKFAAHTERAPTTGSRPFAQLYNIKDDPYEINNLSEKAEYKAIVSTLSKKLLKWMEEVNDPLLEGQLETPYYEKSIKDIYKYK